MHLPADSQVEAEFRSDLPRIPKVNDVILNSGGSQAKGTPVDTGIVHLFQQEAGNRTTAIDVEQSRLATFEVEGACLISFEDKGIRRGSVFPAHFEGMFSFYPSE